MTSARRLSPLDSTLTCSWGQDFICFCRPCPEFLNDCRFLFVHYLAPFIKLLLAISAIYKLLTNCTNLTFSKICHCIMHSLSSILALNETIYYLPAVPVLYLSCFIVLYTVRQLTAQPNPFVLFEMLRYNLT